MSDWESSASEKQELCWVTEVRSVYTRTHTQKEGGRFIIIIRAAERQIKSEPIVCVSQTDFNWGETKSERASDLRDTCTVGWKAAAGAC